MIRLPSVSKASFYLHQVSSIETLVFLLSLEEETFISSIQQQIIIVTKSELMTIENTAYNLSLPGYIAQQQILLHKIDQKGIYFLRRTRT